MLLTDLYIAPSTLTGYARAAFNDLPANQFQLGQWLPPVNVDDLMYRFTRGGETLLDAAPFRAFDTPSSYARRGTGARVTGELPPISQQLRLSEYDRLRLRSGDITDPIVNALYADVEILVRNIAARLELARGEVLTTGKLALSENGLTATVDYGRQAGHTVTAGTLWDAGSGTIKPLTDLLSWTDTYVATNGAAPAVWLASTKLARLVCRNAEIIAAVAGTNTGRTLVTIDELQALLSANGLPRLVIIDEQVKAGGVTTRVIPANKVVLLPETGDQLGGTFFGTTSESLEAEYGLAAGAESGIVAGVYKTSNPVALYTNAAAIALPVLANPDLTFTATVAA